MSVGWQTEPVTGPYGAAQTTDMDVNASGVAFVGAYVPTQSSDPLPGLKLSRIEPDGTVSWSNLFPLGLTEATFVGASPSDGGAFQVASYFNFPVHTYRTMAVKYDGAGNVSWSQEVPALTTTTDIRRATRYLGVDVAGNAYIGGSSSTGGSTSVPRIVSYDPAGNVRFSTPLTLTVGSFVTAATIDVLIVDRVSNNVFVAGHSGFSSAAGTASFVARLLSDGTVVWVRETAAPVGQFVWVRDIDVDGQGRTSILAQRSNSDSYTGTTSFLLERTDVLGAPAGSIPYTAPAVFAQALDSAPDGTVLVSGYKTGAGGGAFVARYDAALGLQWERTVTVAGAISANFDSVTLAANGDVTTTGYRQTQRFNVVEANALCASFDAQGDQHWQFELGWNGAHEFPVAHATDDLGRVRVAVAQLPAGSGTPYQYRQIVLELDPQSHSFCHGDAASACPCGNASGALEQAGCLNSSAVAARLEDAGAASLSSDTLALTCSNVGGSAIGLLVEGSSSNVPIAFGDGLFCFGGSILRLYIHVANAGVLTFPGAGDPAIHARSAALGGPISAGTRRTYQTYYRDAVVAFCPSGGTFNFSNAVLVLWTP